MNRRPILERMDDVEGAMETLIVQTEMHIRQWEDHVLKELEKKLDEVSCDINQQLEWLTNEIMEDRDKIADLQKSWFYRSRSFLRSSLRHWTTRFFHFRKS